MDQFPNLFIYRSHRYSCYLSFCLSCAKYSMTSISSVVVIVFRPLCTLLDLNIGGYISYPYLRFCIREELGLYGSTDFSEKACWWPQCLRACTSSCCLEKEAKISSALWTLVVHHTWLSTVGDRAFLVTAVRVWNGLPVPSTFSGCRLKTHLFNRSFPNFL